MRLLRTFMIVLTLAACGETVSAQQKKGPDHVAGLAEKLEPARKVTYKRVGDVALELHVFEPSGHASSDRRPCFIAIHGGGWVGGEPRRFYPIAAHFTRFGMLGVSVQYRLAKPGSGVTVFDCVQDARSAVRYVRAHAAELGIDPDRIVVAGGSAGGHLAASTAMFPEINADSDDLSISPVPNLLVLYYPVIDTSREGYGNSRIGERWKELSPRHRVRPGMPPTIVLHGTGDTVTPFAGAAAFHESMQQAGNSCELVVHEGGRHGYFMFEADLYDAAMTRTVEFLAVHGYVER